MSVGGRSLKLITALVAADVCRRSRLQPSGFEKNARSSAHGIEYSTALPQLGERRERPPYRRVQCRDGAVAPCTQPSCREPM